MAKRSKLWFPSLLVLLVGLIGIALWRGDEATGSAAHKAKRVDDAASSRSPAAGSQHGMRAAIARTVQVAAERAKESAPQRERVREVVRMLTELARAHLYEGESGQRYRQECTALESERCKDLFTGAAYEVLAWHVDPAMSAGQLGAGDIAAMDTEIVHSEAAALLQHSTDPLERVCMLELLTRSPKLKPVAFPPEVYRGLSAKPVIEANLLLSHGALTGLPDEATTEEVAALASAAKIDPRVQGKALVSLATPSTSALLKDAVRALSATHDPDWAGWTADVAPALGRCGAACSDVMVVVGAGAAAAERLAIYILHRPRSRPRGDVLARLAPALSPATIERLKQSMEI